MPSQETEKILFSETDYIPLLDTSCHYCPSISKKKDVTSKAASKHSMGTQTLNNRTRRMYSQLSVPKLKSSGGLVNNASLYDTYEAKKETTEEPDMFLVAFRLLALNVEPPLPWKIDLLHKSSDKSVKYSIEVVQELSDSRLELANVSSIHWHLMYPHIFAACLTIQSKGGVAIFSLKNPLWAEKFYKLPKPVTCAYFSRISPNLLALGFTTGDVWLLDVSKPNLTVCRKVTAVSPEIVQFIHGWRLEGSGALVYGCGNQIISLRRPFLTYRPIIHESLAYAPEEPINSKGTLLTYGPVVICILRNPDVADQYACGAVDGYLRISSLDISTVNTKLIKAHNGFVCSIKPIPFTTKAYVTCGADGFIKLWMWDLDEPILKCEIPCKSLIDLSWSPVHATVVAAISNNALHIWDIRIKTYSPISTKTFSCALLNIKFSLCGKWITIGTGDGRVLFVSLFNMPNPEYLKKDAFYSAVAKCLQTSGKGELAKKFQNGYE